MGLFLLLNGLLLADEQKLDLPHLQALADDGDLNAQFRLGYAILMGTGVPADPAKGFSIVKDAAEKGYVPAEYDLGYLYREGKGSVVDPAKAYTWFRKAAEDGDPDAERYLADIFHGSLLGQTQDDVEARKWAILAAQKHIVSAQATLAWFYFNGIGGEKNLADGNAWIIHAASGEFANACVYAGHAFATGAEGGGVPQDDVTAWVWAFLGAQWHPTLPSFSKQLLEMQEELAGRMDPAELGNATRQAIDFLALREQGGFSLALGPVAGKVERASPSDSAPFETDGYHIYLAITFGGQGPYRFILDSGCSHSIIDEKLAEKLGLPQRSVFPDSQDHPSLRKVVAGDYAVMGNHITGGLFQALPLDDMSKDAGKEIDGLLGYDFIQRFVVEIDYAKQTVLLSDPQGYQPDPSAKALPISLSMGTPSIQTTLQGEHGDPIPIWLTVDIGAGASVILNDAFARTYQISRLSSRTMPSGGFIISGSDTQTRGRMTSLSMGPFTIAGPIVTYADAFMRGRNPGGALGAGIWQKFKLVLDYSDREIYLTPIADLSQPETSFHAGFSCDPDPNDSKIFRVSKVLTGWPADKAGIKPGDILQSLNGKDIKTLSPQEMKAIVGSGQSYVITVLRGSDSLSFTLQPENL